MTSTPPTGDMPGAAEPGPQTSAGIPFIVTPQAIDKIRDFAAADPANAGKAFRVYVEGGGCAGFRYVFEFGEAEQDDLVVNLAGVTLAVDPLTMQYLRGATLDYKNTLNESGFTVSNPNAKATCGCGMSFGV